MKKLIPLLFLFLLSSSASAQFDSVIDYKNLRRMKFYDVDLQKDGKKTGRKAFAQLEMLEGDVADCTPCIMAYYNERNQLLYEGVSHTDCYIDWYKEYYPDGKLKSSGTFKKGACGKRHGEWIYFNKAGDTIYSELWNDGVFIKQVPEQKQTEIIEIKVLLGGVRADTLLLSPEQVKKIELIPVFKNRSRDGLKLSVEMLTGSDEPKRKFTFDNFGGQLVSSGLLRKGVQDNFSFVVFNNEEKVDQFNLKMMDTVLGNLSTKKYFDVDLSSEDLAEDGWYEVNEKIVSKEKYYYFLHSRDSLENCCPCILEYYDVHEKLMHAAVSCGYCYIGWLKAFYPNGKIRYLGHYKECRIKVGEWIYFSEAGDTLYSEFWENGNFTRQVPEQNNTEIWDIDVVLNGQPVGVSLKSLLPAQLKDIEIVPHFKNQSREGFQLTLKLGISASSKYKVLTLTPEEFKSLELRQVLADNAFGPNDEITYNLRVLNNVSEEIEGYALFKVDSVKFSGIQKRISMIDTEPRYDLFLVNTMDTLKRIKLDKKIYYSLYYDESFSEDAARRKTVSLYGYIGKVRQDSLEFETHSETIDTEFKNGNTIYAKNNFAGRDDVSLKIIEYTRFNSIDFSGKSRETIYNLSNVVFGFSLATTLLVAPLASINYSNGDFNKSRYYKFAGAGLIGLGVSIPLTILTSSKTYQLTKNRSSKDKHKWYMQTIPVPYIK